MTLKLLLVADSDSQLLAAQALAQGAEAGRVAVTVNAVPREGTPAAVLEALERIGPLWRQSLKQLLRDRRLDQFDAIGVYLTGSKLAEFRNVYLASRRQLGLPPRALFCGFNGVVLERFEEAIAWRLGYDLICLNGPRDQARMELMLRHTPFAGQRCVLTGLNRQRAVEPAGERLNRLVFAEQVVMPADGAERRRMVRILAALARRSPDWEVLIKPRVAPHENTFHAVATHISQTLTETLGSPPVNLKLSYLPLAELLRDCRLLATVSSTAVFDALDLGCRPVVMADFGLRQDLGTPFFAGSGLLRRFEQAADLDSLTAGPGPDPDWLEWVGYHRRFSPDNLLEALEQVAGKAERPEPKLQHPGYVINASELATNQLRRAAEAALRRRDWEEAVRLQEIAQLQRPDHRNIARRLAAMRLANPIARRLALLVTPGFRA
ncbi:hypothetical protein KBY96_10065 [Cyanobium sp. ATX 6A2]|uniref:capsular biosynthesis protein n=1 Tax=Cyanobium sp. ATX 6A2 TaxID=2823700 RepID=UPI0020CEE315|nr:capsular biosynthesis protein [Cyanobium sp. ATX 6A2]MCP9888269.1 hypothetical protein [Cyanobium sp. ATX 6A2]